MVDFVPRIRSADTITDSTGRAASVFVQFWDRVCRMLESVFARQAATDARQDAADEAIQDILDTIIGILNGTVPFSELNVASTQYRSFLQKTDGTKLTDADGLNTGLVQSSKIASFGAANLVSAYTAASLDLSVFPTTYSTLQSLVITPRGGPIELRGNFYLRALVGAGDFTDTLVIERFANGVTSYLPEIQLPSAPLSGDDQLVGLQAPAWVDPSPPVGYATTYSLRIKSTASGWTQRYVTHRLLAAQETRITGA